jgi:kynurenine formamidase
MITHEVLTSALVDADAAFLGALVLRTLPNDASKRHRRYPDEPPPYLSHEAMAYIVSLGVRHLLLDLPSVDRAFDEGRLSAHRIFWEMEPAGHSAVEGPASSRTITELIYVDDTVPDGRYLLDLQIAPFVADAAPSRPVLYPVMPR